MSPLERLIRREIAEAGPMTLARYMELSLGHPEWGYYRSGDPLGRAGDFVTAPEVSQMFGEMIGAWVAAVWQASGRPPLRLVELGPGRGTLMADALRVLDAAGAAPEVWFVESSASLRAAQAIAVPAARRAARIDEVPPGPVVVIANEFLDALPMRQFLRTPSGWCERLVGVIGDRLAWGLSEPVPGGDGAPVGAWRERSAAADHILGRIAARLRDGGSAALVIDYGYLAADRPAGPTLQAVRDHAAADPLAAPGEADLTWLIDFDAVRAELSARVAGQGAFLAAMGIGQRAAALARARPDRADDLADALERLTAPAGMGTLFKVAGAVSPGMAPPPGFGGDSAEGCA